MPYSAPLRPPRAPAPSIPPSSPISLTPAKPGHHVTPASSDLSDSFIVVERDADGDRSGGAREEDAESTSTIGTALLAELSDTSSEARYTGSLDGSMHGDLSEAEDHEHGHGEGDVTDDDDVDDVSLPDRPDSRHGTYLEGSYADAEATASLMTDSRRTFAFPPPQSLGDRWDTGLRSSPAAQHIGTDSQFRFIFPSLDASISTVSGTGTSSDGTTPSGSLANLLPPPRLGMGAQPAGSAKAGPLDPVLRRQKERSPSRGVDEGWLRDARVWAPTASMRASGFAVSSGPQDAYHSLQSQSTFSDTDLADKVSADEDVEPVEQPEKSLSSFEVRQQHVRRALAAMAAAGFGGITKRWGFLAFASCAFAILSAVGPSFYHTSSAPAHHALNISSTHGPPQSAKSAYSLERMLNSLPSPATSPAPASSSATGSGSFAPVSLATQLIPDLQLLKAAISTFTARPAKHGVGEIDARSSSGEGTAETAEAVAHDSTLGTFGWRRRKQMTAPTNACCPDHPVTAETTSPTISLSLTKRGSHALSVPSDDTYQSWAKAMAAKVIRPTASADLSATDSSTSQKSEPGRTECTCTATTDTYANPYLQYLLQRAKDYAVSTSTAIGYLYAPMLAHLDQELGEIYRLATFLILHNNTLTAVHRAQRGLGIVTDSIFSAYAGLRAEFERGRQAESERLHRLAGLTADAWRELKEGVGLVRRYLTSEGDRERLGGLVKSVGEAVGDVSDLMVTSLGKVTAEGNHRIRLAKKGLDRLTGRSAARDSTSQQSVAEQPLHVHGLGERAIDTTANADTGSHPEVKTNREVRHPGRFVHTRIHQRWDLRRYGPSRSRSRCRQDPLGRGEGQEEREKREREGEWGRRGEMGRARRTWRKVMETMHHGAVQVVLG